MKGNKFERGMWKLISGIFIITLTPIIVLIVLIKTKKNLTEITNAIIKTWKEMQLEK